MTNAILSEPELKGCLARRSAERVKDPSRHPAAVLLLVYPKEGQYCIHLQKRSPQLEQHGGEVSLPGGRPQSSDGNLLETALRETSEESGIRPEDVILWGQIDDVPTRSGYVITVFVGTIPYPYSFTPNPAEVEEVLEVPLAVLQDPANWREEVRWEQGGITKSYAYTFGPHLIYGATARILGQFLSLVQESRKNGRF